MEKCRAESIAEGEGGREDKARGRLLSEWLMFPFHPACRAGHVTATFPTIASPGRSARLIQIY
jgi:hypothetical protein